MHQSIASSTRTPLVEVHIAVLLIFVNLFALRGLAFDPARRAEDFTVPLKEVSELAKLVTAPTTRDAEGFDSSGKLKPIYFDALQWKGKQTKVFAWLGLPHTAESRVPGIVLVHGGGGTAFKEWVQKWTDHGFAAISIAVEGQTDVRDESKAWQQHEWAGPRRVGIYGDSDQPLKDQWMYHAVADTVLANSLLRSMPQVDPNRIGLMGISWGGVITSTVIGIDDRFAFAIPTYGCGNLATAENQYGRALGNIDFYKNVWDPLIRLHRAKMPTLWLSWPGEEHFPLNLQATCYEKVPGETMVSLIPGMKHSHGAGWNPPDSYAFAQSVVTSGKPWCRQTESQISDHAVFVAFESTKPLNDALLVSTSDTGVTGSRTWIKSPATFVQTGSDCRVTAALLPGTTAWFINVHADGLTVSSAFKEVE